jgi:hypothetical protein
MFTKLTASLFILCATAMLGLAPSQALAGSTKDTGSMEGEVVKRDAQPIPDQDGHLLILGESKGKASNPGGSVDGYDFSVREALDLRQGSGSQHGYVIFSKGSDQRVVAIEGNVATTMKNGQPNTTFQGDWTIVSGKGKNVEEQGKGTYSGYYTSPEKYHVDWTGQVNSKKEGKAD